MYFLGALAVAIAAFATLVQDPRRARWFALASVPLLAVGSYMGLFVAPPEKFMGEVMRILYVHVPTAWNALLLLTAAFVFAVLALWKKDPRWDWWMEAAIEIGLVLGLLLTAQGSIWARPTWGVYWDWDPRLTSVAVMNVTFLGIVALRSFVDDAETRQRWSAVATILAYANVPIVYMSVKWWRTLHQEFSNPDTVDATMVLPLRLNALGVLCLALAFLGWRYLVAERVRRVELAPPEAA